MTKGQPVKFIATSFKGEEGTIVGTRNKQVAGCMAAYRVKLASGVTIIAFSNAIQAI